MGAGRLSMAGEVSRSGDVPSLTGRLHCPYEVGALLSSRNTPPLSLDVKTGETEDMQPGLTNCSSEHVLQPKDGHPTTTDRAATPRGPHACKSQPCRMRKAGRSRGGQSALQMRQATVVHVPLTTTPADRGEREVATYFSMDLIATCAAHRHRFSSHG